VRDESAGNASHFFRNLSAADADWTGKSNFNPI
jgi:hypothetical protein